jgi:hypothetical protein
VTERESFNCDEQKRRIIAARVCCEVCGEPGTQLAHRIPQSKDNLNRYGKAIIHHEKNLALVCGLACNAAVNIDHDPLAKWRLVREIRETLEPVQGRLL